MATSGWDSFIKPFLTDGEVDFAKLIAGGLSVYQAYQVIQQAMNPPKYGYQGKIEDKTATRGFTGAPVLEGVGDRTGHVRPGSGGKDYFTRTRYAKTDLSPTGQLAQNKATTATEVAGLQAANNRNAAIQVANQTLDKQAALANNNPNGTATALIDPKAIPGVKASTEGLGGKVTDTTDDPLSLQIKAKYREAFGREPDAAGLAYWKDVATKQGVGAIDMIDEAALTTDISAYQKLHPGAYLGNDGKNHMPGDGYSGGAKGLPGLASGAAGASSAGSVTIPLGGPNGGSVSVPTGGLKAVAGSPVRTDSATMPYRAADTGGDAILIEGGTGGDPTAFRGVQGAGTASAAEPMSQYKDLAGNLIPQRIIDAQQGYIKSGGASDVAARAAQDQRVSTIRDAMEGTGLNALTSNNQWGTKDNPNGFNPAALQHMKDSGKDVSALTTGFGMAEGGLTALARGGRAQAPRYLRGETDGMADKIPATIEGNQPAALAHGEFVIPADVVSHLGNGNSDAGAKQLYKMMDKIRMARTGRKSQGKRINPDKFAPGGIAGYKAGGSVIDPDGVARFTSQGSVSSGTGESSLSNWAGDYVTDLLSNAKAASSGEIGDLNFMTYGEAVDPDTGKPLGPLSAGDSALQTQAYDTASKLATPDALNSAAKNAGALAQKYDSLDYTTPAVQASTVNADSRGYAADKANVEKATAIGYDATKADQTKLDAVPLNTYQANLNNFQMEGPQEVTTDKFYQNNNAQNYMSPYMQQVVENQQRDAQRQADIASTGRHADMVKQGAFGGSRTAVMDAEAARNLAQQKGDIQAQGLQNSYQQAQQQYSTDAARGLQAGTANQNAALGVGTQNLGANLQTQALGATTGLQAALANQQMQGQYGLAQGQLTNATNLANAGFANQASQFGSNAYNQNSQFNANLGTQTNLANSAAANQAAAFGSQAYNNAQLQNSQLGTQVNLANAASQNQNNQFGANFGLQALAGQNSAIGLQGQMGTAQNQAGLANLNAQLQAGNQQQATTQAGITADINDFNAQRDAPLKQLQFQQSFLSGMPLTAQNTAASSITSSTP